MQLSGVPHMALPRSLRFSDEHFSLQSTVLFLEPQPASALRSQLTFSLKSDLLWRNTRRDECGHGDHDFSLQTNYAMPKRILRLPDMYYINIILTEIIHHKNRIKISD